MANPSAIISQIQQTLERLEAKIDLLLAERGLEYRGPAVRLDSPKPTKTYVSALPAIDDDKAVPDDIKPALHSRKKSN